MTSANTMSLYDLRNTKLLEDLAAQLRMHSLTISPTSSLSVGGSGTLVTYKSRSGILTATHVIADHLNIRNFFSPVIATEDITLFKIAKVPIKRILYLETPEGIESLKKNSWQNDILDICFIEIEEADFRRIIQMSSKKPVDLLHYQEKYKKNPESYNDDNDWVLAFDGSPREEIQQNDDKIFTSPFDGCYLSGGKYNTTPLSNKHVNVMPPLDGYADLYIHQLGETQDFIPSTFGGASGAGVWRVAFEGDEGVPKGINELFFTGVLVAESERELQSRGPSSLYEVFLPCLDTIT